MPKFSVIVVAAGRGERFGGKEGKIFAKVGEQPLFLRAVHLFANREDVSQTILVVAGGDVERVKSLYGPNLGFMGIRLVEGGAERQESVANGLAAVSEDADFVAIHDAVRVCIADEWIDRIFEAANQHGAVVPVAPVTATLKRVAGDRSITATVAREGLHLAQTPQVFRRAIIKDAYDRLSRNELDFGGVPITDDAQIVAAAGHAVTAVDGDPRNIKVTSRADLTVVTALIKTLPQKAVTRRGAFEEAQW